MSFQATLDGDPVFGQANQVRMNPHPNAQQINAFFGVTGLQTLYGGGRGRTFMVSGVLVGEARSDIVNARADLLSYADGQTHTLVDTDGTSWDNVIFRGEFQPESDPRPLAGGGWCLPFKCVMESLT